LEVSLKDETSKLYKFRVSDHSLEIESGRYKSITREERKCKNCNLNEIGDEYHFFLKCTANHSLEVSMKDESFSNVFFTI
jgi:hypothetical protein